MEENAVRLDKDSHTHEIDRHFSYNQQSGIFKNLENIDL